MSSFPWLLHCCTIRLSEPCGQRDSEIRRSVCSSPRSGLSQSSLLSAVRSSGWIWSISWPKSCGRWRAAWRHSWRPSAASWIKMDRLKRNWMFVWTWISHLWGFPHWRLFIAPNQACVCLWLDVEWGHGSGAGLPPAPEGAAGEDSPSHGGETELHAEQVRSSSKKNATTCPDFHFLLYLNYRL